LIQELLDIVEIQTRPWMQIPGINFEWFRRRLAPRAQPDAQYLIHRFLEGSPGLPHLGFELGADILV
jgi:hypothetical protein